MKLVLVSLMALALAEAVDPQVVLKKLEEAMAVAGECAKTAGASMQDMQALHAHNTENLSHEAKCTISCVYQHYKVQKADGSWDQDEVTKFLDALKTLDEDLYEKMNQIRAVCGGSEVTGDPCETAGIMAHCIVVEGKKMGLSKEELLAG